MLLDRYVIRQFLSTFFFTLLALSLLFVVIDLFEHLDKFIDRNVGLLTALEYYLVYLPFINKLLIPVATLLAALFGVGRLATTNELTAMRASGRSNLRFIAPYLTVAVLISLGQVWFNGWVVPEANAKKQEIERRELGEGSGGSLFNLYFRDVPTRNVYIEFYDRDAKTARTVRVEEFGNVDHPRLQWRIDAPTMQWDSAGRRWIAQNAERRTFLVDSIVYEVVDSADVPFTIAHEDIVRLQRGIEELTLDEMDDYIVTLKTGGKDTRQQEIHYYSEWAFPFANIVIICIAIPFASVRRRGGIAVNVAAAMVVAFAYIAFTELSKAIGAVTEFDPMIVGWSANAVFLIAALVSALVLRR